MLLKELSSDLMFFIQIVAMLYSSKLSFQVSVLFRMAITLTQQLMSEGVLGSSQQPYLEAVLLCSCELVETLESFLSVRVLDTARGGKTSSRLLSSLTEELFLLEGRVLSKIFDSEDFTLVGSVETGTFHFYTKAQQYRFYNKRSYETADKILHTPENTTN